MLRILAAFLILCFPVAAEPTTPAEIAREILAPLLDQARIATLKGDRPINTRTYKVHYWLETGHRGGGDVPAMLETAQAATGDKDSPARRTDRAALIWSRRKLEIFGCFTPEGLAKLRRGGSPVIASDHRGRAQGRQGCLGSRLAGFTCSRVSRQFLESRNPSLEDQPEEISEDHRARSCAC